MGRVFENMRPEILEHLESGELSCSSAAVIAKHVGEHLQLIGFGRPLPR